MKSIDLNADVGEGCGDDESLIPLVTSVNIACGVHAGDASTMRAAVRLAASCDAAIGAHPSFPDRERFGRAEMQRSPDDIYTDVRTQIEALMTIAREEGARIEHVKAHGALYNVAARDRTVADAVSRAVARILPGALLYGLAGGAQMESAAAFGLRAVPEGFADRRYMPDGSLVPRGTDGALIDDEEEAARQAIDLATSGRAQTICLHGDGAHAIAFAQRIRRALFEAGIGVRPPG